MIKLKNSGWAQASVCLNVLLLNVSRDAAFLYLILCPARSWTWIVSTLRLDWIWSGKNEPYPIRADDIQLVTDTDRRPLRSAAARTCFVPRTHNSFGDQSLSAASPCVWNNLPPHLQHDVNWKHFYLGVCKPRRDHLLFCAIEILLLTYFFPPRYNEKHAQ